MTCKSSFHLVAFIILFQFVAQNATGLHLKLVPWDSPDSPLYPGNLTLLETHQRILHSSRKVQYLRLSPNGTTNLEQMPLRVKHEGSLSYSVNVRIGNPGKTVNLLVDTGSGFSWTHCVDKPASYYPLHSRTYEKMSCDHHLCKRPICKCNSYNQCECPAVYGPSRLTYMLKGSIDTFHFPDFVTGNKMSFPNILFGCSVKQTGHNLPGILGLDRMPGSIPIQLRTQTRGKFSYCLSGENSYLTLGGDIISQESGRQVRTTPLIHTHTSQLFLNLTDISVAGKRLSLSHTTFSLQNGGVLLDTGSQQTMLVGNVYDKVSKAYARYLKAKKLKKVQESYWNLKPCYQVPHGFTNFPSFTYHFEGGADLVSRHTYMYGKEGVACMAAEQGERTIIGAFQQLKNKFMFDINANVLKFHTDDCAGH